VLKVAIIGAGGYTGTELVSIVLRHPHARIVGLFGSAKRADAPQRIDEMFPQFAGRISAEVRPADAPAIVSLEPDAAFLCTPHEASLALAPDLLARGIRVFDLSAAFRLKDGTLYPKHYGFEHTQPGWLAKAAYGLVELNRDQIAGADLVAVPGCSPPSAILPIAPLVRGGAIEPGRRPIIDSVSGVSGAGRAPELKHLFCEVSLHAYSVLGHRHNPEIDAYAGTPTVFTPHLGPYDRGIVSTVHVDLAPDWNEARVRDALRAAYGNERFIRLLPPGKWPSVNAVKHTNFCDIALAVDEPHRHLILSSAIDNLVKGAAGQAVQCFNLRFGLPETTALLPDHA